MSQPKTIQSSLPTDPNVSYIDTVRAYDQWANIYDGDGNFLQALDTVEMRSLLPAFLSRVETYLQLEEQQQQQRELDGVKLVDMGCGTGRNTLQLLATVKDRQVFQDVQIVGLDASNGMLDVARQAIQKLESTRTSTSPPVRVKTNVTLSQFDLLTQSPAQSLDLARNADGMISTLVLEHIPLDTYFASAAALLRPGAYFLVTNMHADMGRRSQAGFIDPASGKKVRPTRSYAHEIKDVVEEATRAGFEVVPLPVQLSAAGRQIDDDGVIERTVTEDMVEILGQRSSKYVGVTVWFGICFRKKL